MINTYNILNGVKYFAEGESQNCLLFQSISGYFQTFAKLIKISHGNLKDCQKKVLKLRLHQAMAVFHLQKIRVKIKENYLIQDTINFLNVNVVNYYFIYEIDT